MVDVDAPEQAVPEPVEAKRKGFTIGRVLAIMTVIGMVIFWVWIFSGAPAKQNPDRLKDEAYVTLLQGQCKAMVANLADLPNAAHIKTASARADVLDDANVIVGRFIDDVEAKAPTTGDAAVSMAGWIKDWRTYLADRQDYATRLHTDPNAQLLLDRSEIGSDSVDQTIQVFTQVNNIPECDTPGDVG
ncbi:hypothetical protein [Aquihabitans sp. McL0605]|uniref:hypothetical protein n=1 Tax=Aquihabitans sp. McL0605 TaxID=3415671 RepID=UPI003CE9E185